MAFNLCSLHAPYPCSVEGWWSRNWGRLLSVALALCAPSSDRSPTCLCTLVTGEGEVLGPLPCSAAHGGLVPRSRRVLWHSFFVPFMCVTLTLLGVKGHAL